MKLEEALPLLRAGERIRRLSYEEGTYHYIQDGYLFTHWMDGSEDFRDTLEPHEYLATDFEVYEEATDA